MIRELKQQQWARDNLQSIADDIDNHDDDDADDDELTHLVVSFHCINLSDHLQW